MPERVVPSAPRADSRNLVRDFVSYEVSSSANHRFQGLPPPPYPDGTGFSRDIPGNEPPPPYATECDRDLRYSLGQEPPVAYERWSTGPVELDLAEKGMPNTRV